MDNVILNISIDDIIPNNNHQYDQREIEKLAASIKQLGLLEPITVRPSNDKYELILGNKRYKAATMAGLKTIPAIVKKIDDNKIKDYLNLNNKTIDSQFLSKNMNTNSDVISLSKLSEEYERDELKMNNTQIDNNNIVQTPNNNQPAFGGRFFPSLEDEPTNMSFSDPISEPQQNNNFIDLTDINTESQQPVGQVAVMSTPTNNGNQILESIPQPPISTPFVENQSMPQMPIDNNIINLESLKQNNELITPSMNIDNNFQEVTNDFQPDLSQPINTFQMEQPVINPAMEPQGVQVQQSIEPQYNNQFNQTEVVTPMQPIMDSPIIEPMINQQIVENPMSNPVISQPIAPQQPVVEPIQSIIPEQPVQKDILPVINAIKSTTVSLESFGYTIRITDEDLPTSYKITIEVNK